MIKKNELANIMEMQKAQNSITMCPIGLSIWYFEVTVKGVVWHIFLFCFWKSKVGVTFFGLASSS
jgi:hypothetical protein